MRFSQNRHGTVEVSRVVSSAGEVDGGGGRVCVASVVGRVLGVEGEVFRV